MTEKEIAEQLEYNAYLAHQAEMAEDVWHPIDTAPHDRPVLTCEDGPRYQESIRVCWWVSDEYDGAYWQDDADSEPEPTHWMAIPLPPK